jgi:hypothetical protein
MKKNILLPLVLIMFITVSCKNKNNLVSTYYPNGIIKSESQMKDGMRNGLTKNYDEKGRLLSTAELVNDKYEGWLITYNSLNGKVTAKSHYKDDKQNGSVTTYYDEGQLYREETYINGRLDSLVKTYWPDGRLQAEVYYKMGAPGVGLKEIDRDGKPVKQPEIIVREINKLASQNAVTVKVYLSDNNPKVDFFLGELKDGIYLDSGKLKVKSKDGVADLQYKVLKRHSLKEKISIIAKVRTKYGNTLVLNRNYNLVVNN